MVGEVSCPLLFGLMLWASHVSCLSLGVLLCQVGPMALFQDYLEAPSTLG